MKSRALNKVWQFLVSKTKKNNPPTGQVVYDRELKKQVYIKASAESHCQSGAVHSKENEVHRDDV